MAQWLIEGQWRGLQPAGFNPCKDEFPQAEASATKNLRVNR